MTLLYLVEHLLPWANSIMLNVELGSQIYLQVKEFIVVLIVATVLPFVSEIPSKRVTLHDFLDYVKKELTE